MRYTSTVGDTLSFNRTTDRKRWNVTWCQLKDQAAINDSFVQIIMFIQALSCRICFVTLVTFKLDSKVLVQNLNFKWSLYKISMRPRIQNFLGPHEYPNHKNIWKFFITSWFFKSPRGEVLCSGQWVKYLRIIYSKRVIYHILYMTWKNPDSVWKMMMTCKKSWQSKLSWNNLSFV